MALPRLTKLELQIMEALWTQGACCVRDIQAAFPEKNRPAYTTVQTIVYRMEAKQAIRRVQRVGNADVFEPLIAQDVTRSRVIEEVLSFFGGRAQPMMAQLAEAGKVTLDDVRELEKTVRRLQKEKQETARKSK